MTDKNYKMLVEFIYKEKTPEGAIGILESVKLMKSFGNLAEQLGFDCYVKGYLAEKLEHEPNGKTYKIKTVDDIAKLTPTQFEFFIDDLRIFCQARQNLQLMKDADLIDFKSPKFMIWIDDGVNKGTLKAEIQSTNKL